MPKFNLDLSEVGLNDGEHVAVIQKVQYQIKTGEKWNADGTSTVDADTFGNTPQEKTRLHYVFSVPGKGIISRDFYLSDKALVFLKEFYQKAGGNIEKGGFDPELIVGKTIGISVQTKTEGEYARQEIVKFFKA